jgi:hypothetical protein
MGIVGLLFVCVMLVLIGVGIAVGLVACAMAALLLGLGMISSSVLVGMRSGRPADGIRLFLLQCGLIVGVPAGAACAWLGSSLAAELQGVVDWQVIIGGGLAGATAGGLVALALDLMSRRLQVWAAEKLPGRKPLPAPSPLRR